MDAKYYNGGPDDGYRSPATGPRIEPEDPLDGLRFICHHCGGTVQYVYSLADVGVFCSASCREQATTAQTRGVA